jgi:hypothetical protein
MIPNLSGYINKTILACIPALAEDGKCRPFTLASIEMIGMWLEGPLLEERFLSHQHRDSAARDWKFFVPFSQIACVAMPTGTATSAATETSSRGGGEATSPADAAQDAKGGASIGNAEKPKSGKTKKG